MEKIRYELQAEAGDGTWETWDFEYKKENAISWFNEQITQYPDCKFRVIECHLNIIAECKIKPIIY